MKAISSSNTSLTFTQSTMSPLHSLSLIYGLLMANLFPYLTDADDLNYAYLKAMGAACYPEDSCHSVLPQNCRCDPTCSKYGDCCIDTFERITMIDTFSSRDWKCLEASPGRSVMVKNNCGESWKGASTIRENCEVIEKMKGPQNVLQAIPVSSKFTQITYKNYYCAVCNEDHGNLTFWDVAVSCDSVKRANYTISPQYVHDSLEYSSELNRWGIKIPDDEFKEFYPCSIYSEEEPVLNEEIQIRDCHLHVTSECSKFWRDENVRKKCQQYQALVQGPSGAVFRNVHCALCNFFNIRALKCSNMSTTVDTAPSMNLIVYNVINGESSIGETTTCTANEVFDPFFKVCRSLEIMERQLHQKETLL